MRYLTTILLLISSIVLHATEYKINSGSELNNLSLQAGDVVIMADGNWVDQELKLRGTGTELNPIILKAETGGEVILTGESFLEMAGEYLIVDGLTFKNGSLSDNAVISFRTSSSSVASNSRLTNTKIVDYNPSNKDTDYKWVSLYGENNRVDHCHFEGKNHSGALMVVWMDETPDYHTIDSNYFGPRPDLGYNGGEIIRIGTSDWSMYDSYCIVEGNLFEKCDGEIEIISNKSCNNIYRNNTFRACKGTLTLRHGNDCEVYGNFFYGVAWKDCGGIRIIGENHKVYNNYLQDLPDDGFRAAICLTNGVPNSPLNRYFQVKNAEVVNNTIVNCEHPFVFGAGKSTELSLAPVDCKIANNVVVDYANVTDMMIDYQDTPTNVTYSNNIVFGSTLGIDATSGIEETDPALVEGDIWRPADTSIVVDYGTSDFTYITHDIDSQTRTGDIDAGCDEISDDAVINKPLNASDVGVGWASSIKEVPSSEGGSTLKNYIDNANDGDVIILTTSGGTYTMPGSTVLSKNVKIRQAYGLGKRPIVKASGTLSEFIKLQEGAKLYLEGVEFQGGAGEANAFTSIIVTDNESIEIDAVTILNCVFSDLLNTESRIINAGNSTTFNTLTVNDVQVYNVAKQAFSFADGSLVKAFDIENATFSNIGNEIISIGETNSAQSEISLNHCTIDSIGYESSTFPMFTFNNAAVTIINSILSRGHSGQPAFSISGANSAVNYTAFWKTDAPTLENGATLGTTVWTNTDPLFAAPNQQIFSLMMESFALNAASNGTNLGDPFWDIKNGQPNNNALLASIVVDGFALEGFSASTKSYTVEVDSAVYTLEATTQDVNAEIEIFYPASLPGDLYIQSTAENGINKELYTVSVSVKQKVGVANKPLVNNEISLFPNPCNGNFTVKSQLQGTVNVYNSLGQLVKSFNKDNSSFYLDVNYLPKGMYFLEIMASNQAVTSKFIIKNNE